MSPSLKFTMPAIARIADIFIALDTPGRSVDHLLVLADSLQELAEEQHRSGLSICARSSRATASRLREAANARQNPSLGVLHGASHAIR